MTVSEPPYYNSRQDYTRQSAQPMQPAVPPVQVPAQKPPQPVVVQQPPVHDENGIERPNEKNVPKFAQILKNLGRKRNND